MSGSRLIDATRLPAYDLGSGHPFGRDRQRPLFDLIRRQGLVDEAEILPCTPASGAELELAHGAAYVAAVRAVSARAPTQEALARAWRFGMGTSDNPIAPGQHDGASAIAGATLACVRAVMSGACGRAFNPAGGLHHAKPDAASGFCVYNDLVIGIREALRLGAARVMYVDFDVHHGDGVELAFRDDRRVLTVSFHETPEARFPGTGFVDDRGEGPGLGYAVNAPLASFTGDASWLDVVRAVLPRLARAFRPDLLVSQHGCDPHFSDPLAGLCLTTQAMAEAAAITARLADEVCEGRWVATGGGGYQPFFVIPRVWSMVWMTMSGRAIPERLAPEWIEAWRERAGGLVAERFFDDEVADPRIEEAARTNRATLVRLLELLAAHGHGPGRGGRADGEL